MAGGAEVLLDRLLCALSNRGHDVTLVCGGPVSQRNYPVIEAGSTYSQYLRAPIVCATRFGQADVVIDVENGLPFFSPLWRRKPSVCLVHHVHTDQWGMQFPAPVAAMGRFVETQVMPAAYRKRVFIAVSRSTAEALRDIGVADNRIEVIENGVDIPSGPMPPKASEPLFLSLSRLVPHKRLDLLLRAWALAAPALGGRLVVAGDGPGLAALRRLATETPLVEVVGRITETEKSRLLAESWAVVSAAHHEGWGMSVMEAAAHGTPALAADAPGIRDVIVDGVTGVLVRAPERELPEALARAWVQLASDADARDRMGEAARNRAIQFTWERTVDRWLEVLEDVAGTSPVSHLNGRARRAHGSGSHTHAGDSQLHLSAAAESNSDPASGGMRRSIRLFNAFRFQFDDPDGFYTLLANDTVALVDRYHPLAGERVLDIGGGAGYFAKAFRRAEAESCFVEPFWDELTAAGRGLGYGVIADGMRLPFADGTFDVTHSSNVIEHVTDPMTFFEEMLRVIRPGGTMFLAFTNWFSPFGGHETSPWHYLGGERAAMRYERTTGHAPKNRYGMNLFRLDISEVLAWARSAPNADLIDTFPRYYPVWTKPVVALPGVREVVTWNLALVMRRH